MILGGIKYNNRLFSKIFDNAPLNFSSCKWSFLINRLCSNRGFIRITKVFIGLTGFFIEKFILAIYIISLEGLSLLKKVLHQIFDNINFIHFFSIRLYNNLAVSVTIKFYRSSKYIVIPTQTLYWVITYSKEASLVCCYNVTVSSKFSKNLRICSEVYRL